MSSPALLAVDPLSPEALAALWTAGYEKIAVYEDTLIILLFRLLPLIRFVVPGQFERALWRCQLGRIS